MTDRRIHKQAQILVDWSVEVKEGDVVRIVGGELAKPLILAVYRRVLQKKPKEVKVDVVFDEFKEIYYKEASRKQILQFPHLAFFEVKHSDVFIKIWAPGNTRNLTNVDPQKQTLRAKVTKPLTDWIVEHTRWVVTVYPTPALAQEADMSLAEFEDFLWKAICKVDWKELAKKQEKLVKLLNRTGEVRILAPGTDLRMSIRGRKAVSDRGKENLPGGEVFTSPLEESVEGFVSFTYPAIYRGREICGIKLVFEKGQVVEAKAEKGEEFLEKILETDRGARYVGELGIGNTYQIKRFVKNILFDEKIGGTVHLALGFGYKETGSRNNSAIHWDMILDLRKGGAIYFDGRLVQKDGTWQV